MEKLIFQPNHNKITSITVLNTMRKIIAILLAITYSFGFAPNVVANSMSEEINFVVKERCAKEKQVHFTSPTEISTSEAELGSTQMLNVICVTSVTSHFGTNFIPINHKVNANRNSLLTQLYNSPALGRDPNPPKG